MLAHELRERAFPEREHQLREVAADARQRHLRLGIAEARVVLEDLEAVARAYQAREDDAAERRATRDEGARDRRDELVGPLLRLLVGEHARRRHSAHAARVRSGVAVAEALVIARGRQRHDGLAVHERLQADLRTLEPLFEYDGAAVRGRRTERDACFLRGAAERDALARGEAVRLHDQRRVPPIQRGTRIGGTRERLPERGGHPRLAHELLREGLAPLDLRGLARGSDHSDAAAPERVGDAIRDEVIGPHDREIDLRGREVLLQPSAVARRELERAREERQAGVARHDIDHGRAVRAREPPRDRVLAAAAPEHKTVEARTAAWALRAPVGTLLEDRLAQPLLGEEAAAFLLFLVAHITPTRSWPAASKTRRRRRGSPRGPRSRCAR